MTWGPPMPLYISLPRSAHFDDLAELAYRRSEPIIDTEQAADPYRGEKPGSGHRGRSVGTTHASIAERRRRVLLFLVRPRITLAVAFHAGIAKRTALWLLTELHAEGLVTRSRGPGSGSPALWTRGEVLR